MTEEFRQFVARLDDYVRDGEEVGETLRAFIRRGIASIIIRPKQDDCTVEVGAKISGWMGNPNLKRDLMRQRL